jgi:hypothetical protein
MVHEPVLMFRDGDEAKDAVGIVIDRTVEEEAVRQPR